jgi:hypothetical protein
MVNTPKAPDYINAEDFVQSMNMYEQNHFVQFLARRFGRDVAQEMVKTYCIGTSINKTGATVFWQIDQGGNIRAGKEMLYNKETGKRLKGKDSYFNWVHSNGHYKGFNLVQCLFGQHLLLRDKQKTVAIVESEKTAVIASHYLPKFSWLATGGAQNLSERKMAALQGRKVVVYPDLGCFDEWKQKIAKFKHHSHIHVSDLLERNATPEQREQGLDIVDFLLQIQPVIEECIHLNSDSIVDATVQTNLGSEFHHCKLLFVRTRDGKYYDLLFDSNDEYLNGDAHQTLVCRINAFYEKNLRKATIDGQPCFVNTCS